MLSWMTEEMASGDEFSYINCFIYHSWPVSEQPTMMICVFKVARPKKFEIRMFIAQTSKNPWYSLEGSKKMFGIDNGTWGGIFRKREFGSGCIKSETSQSKERIRLGNLFMYEMKLNKVQVSIVFAHRK